MTKFKPLPSQQELRRLFDYDPEIGKLIWRTKPFAKAHSVRIGEPAGCVGQHGYRQIGVNKILYRASRLIWMWMTGDDPGRQLIDHRNHNRSDDRWENLRLCTSQQNNRHRSTATNVYYQPPGPRNVTPMWRVRFFVDGFKHSFGSYKTEAEAKAVAASMRQEIYGDFA